VTVFDNSPRQLAQDRVVAEREDLNLLTVEGDMRALQAFGDQKFDLIVHPCSNLFIPEVNPLWSECARVLKPGGVLLAGFVNPVLYLFDQRKIDDGVLEVRHKLPYSDLTSISKEERRAFIRAGEALEFGHTLTDQIGGQLDAGLALTGFYEDRWEGQPPADYTDTYIASRAVRLNFSE
jgi:SAM-dependent methyltransferase